MSTSHNVVQQGSHIYLHTGNDLYKYDGSSAPVDSGAMGVISLSKILRQTISEVKYRPDMPL